MNKPNVFDNLNRLTLIVAVACLVQAFPTSIDAFRWMPQTASAQDQTPPENEDASEDEAKTEEPTSLGEGESMPAIGPRPRAEMTLPDDSQLLNGPKHDWVVFVNPEDTGVLSANTPIPPDTPEYVLVVEPLYPRPGTLRAITEKINQRFDSKVFVDRALLEELSPDDDAMLRIVIYEEMESDELKLHTIKRAQELPIEGIEESIDESQRELPDLIIEYFRQEVLRTSKQLKGESLKKILINQVEKLTPARYLTLKQTVMKEADNRFPEGTDAEEKREIRRQRQADHRATVMELREIRAERLKLMLEERSKLDLLNLVLVDGGEQPEVRIRMRYVKEIIYHEDLMLQRIDELIGEKKLGKAFEMAYLLERETANWPGLVSRQSKLLLAEAIAKRDAGDLEGALILIEESFLRDKSTSGLSEQAGEVVSQLVDAALADSDNRKARHFIRRLKTLFPEHPIVTRWESLWSTGASELLNQAQSAYSEGRYEDATEHVRLASHIWPTEPQLPGLYRRIVGRSQRLEIGVLRRFDVDPQFPWLTVVQERNRRLLYVDLFEATRVQTQTHYSSRFFQRWEPTNLGREAKFWLRTSRRLDETIPTITARQIADELYRRIRPESPEYDERLASFLESVQVKTPYEFTVYFSRIPFEAETLFRFPVTSDDTTEEIELASAESSGDGAPSRKIGQRFYIHDRTPERILYRRVKPEPDGLGEYHIAEVMERYYPHSGKALQALARGEISMLTRIEHADLANLQNDDRFTVVKYGLPLTHLLQFHPRSEFLKNVQIRRALAFGIQREKILGEIILEKADGSLGRLISAPYSRQHAAYNKLLDERPFDVTMSLSLLFSVRKQFPDGLPLLRMVCEPDERIRAAASKMIEDWSRLGLNVELLPVGADLSDADESGLPAWDIVYRTVTVEDPMANLWPLICQEPTARVDALAFLPDWLRQEFIELEDATDFKKAVACMHRLHDHLQNEAIIIPLWETDEFLLYRKNIKGIVNGPIWTYQDVESWSLTPWYPTDPP